MSVSKLNNQRKKQLRQLLSVGKVTFDHGIVQLGIVLADPFLTSQSDIIGQQTDIAVIRYNVTPVDRLFTLNAAPCNPGANSVYKLALRGLAASNAHVAANLIEIDLDPGTKPSA